MTGVTAYIAPNFAAMPVELRRLPRWVTWRAEQRAGEPKPRKVPYRADMSRTPAKTDDPDTWGSFEQAKAAYLNGGRTGIGFVLDGTGDIAGIDIDDCRDAATGAVDPRALALLEELGAGYSEVSPSGTGLRGFGYAPPLDTGCKGTLDGLKVELYSKGRYLTLTGLTIKAGALGQLRGFGDLAERIRADRKVNPKTGEIEQCAPDEHHAELVRRVVSGEVYHDSLRDLAASLVATGMQAGAAVNHLRGLMDASAAPRDDRWQTRYAQIPDLVSSADAKFGPAAVAFTALVESSKASNERRYRLLTADELRGLPSLAWSVHGVLPTVGVAALFGPSSSGKSFLAFDLGTAIAEGRRWFDHRVTPAPVVYCALEGEAGFKLRAQAWELHHGQPLPEGLRMMLQSFKLTELQDVADLAAVVPAGAVVFLDTLNRAAPLADENSSKDMGEILEAAKRLQAATDGLVVLIHHTGKDAARGLRGHSSLFAAMDACIEVSREGDRREWKVSKAKDGQDGTAHPFGLEVLTLGTDEHGDAYTSCVVTAGEGSAGHTPRLTPAQRMARDSLVKACEQAGDLNEAGALRGVHVEDWRVAFYATSTADSAHAKKVAFQRARGVLCGAGLAIVEQDFYRPTDPALHFQIVRAISNHQAAQDGTQTAHVPGCAGTNGTQPYRGVPVCRLEAEGLATSNGWDDTTDEEEL